MKKNYISVIKEGILIEYDRENSKKSKIFEVSEKGIQDLVHFMIYDLQDTSYLTSSSINHCEDFGYPSLDLDTMIFEEGMKQYKKMLQDFPIM